LDRRPPDDATRLGTPSSWSAALTLVDTSVSIEVFRKAGPVEIESLVGLDNVVTYRSITLDCPRAWLPENHGLWHPICTRSHKPAS